MVGRDTYTGPVDLTGLCNLVASEPTLAQAIGLAREGAVRSLDVVVADALRPLAAAALTGETGRPLLIVTSTYREAEHLADALASLLQQDAVAYYPAWETLPHERLSPRSDIVGRRLEVLRRLAGNDELPEPKVIVAPVRAVLQPQVAGLGDLIPVTLTVGEEHDLNELARSLAQAAYTRVDLVEHRGEFAVRGGIVDVFPPTMEHPVRIDFFGDTVDEIRPFTVADQRSTDATWASVTAGPCREMLVTDQVRGRAAAHAADPATPSSMRELFERIANGHAVDGMEALAPALVDRLEMLVDVVPAETLVVVSDPERVRTRALELHQTSREFADAAWHAAAESGQAPIDMDASAYKTLADVRSGALERGLSWWTLSDFAEDPESLQVRATTNDAFNGDVESALNAIADAVADGWTTVLVADNPGRAARLTDLLTEHELASAVTVVTAALAKGFRAETIRLAVFTAGDLTGRFDVDKAAAKMPARRRNTIDPLELKAGDYVVHERHGVGKYVEMGQRTVAGAVREYLVVEYAPSKRGHPGDRLFLPMDQLDQISRYVGGEMPTLDKLGGSDWAKRKSRARRAVRQIAAELIKLYAARQASRGHAYGPDNPWQHELENAFSYVETPDQLAAITDVKADMEQIVPMDRLVCGDVGFGKTEIAVRAAFKAVMDGKQVAVLVPTTLLVQQHLATFAERYAGFPVTVAPLSRFSTASETKKVIAGLADGTVDVVVGTHRLLSDSVAFKDLGLVIIDEEQRFGVEHKEQLKALRTNVDVLAMSATPIPRSLEMAITGIRELSVIATPPEERHPVLTFAGPYEDGQVRAALRRELAREGQVFFIHNRVSSIERAAARLRDLVPEARIAVAHGQMNENVLEQVMLDFWERRVDVLVCTTIIEAGLDISTANTLLIERADQLGLSQLHQLRGRVGRGRERGYAYFLYPPDKPLTQAAHDRLATMAVHTDLGAGMAIAMKDLEIRGAGNLLGGEQSGHIADVGFDLYLRLVGEAVAEVRGEDAEPEPEMRIELPVEAHLPVDYVESERLRLEMYKRLAGVRNNDELAQVSDELLDRYGALPEPVIALLEVTRFRLLCREVGITEVVSTSQAIRFSPADLPDSRQLRLNRLYPGAKILKAAGHVVVPRPMTAKVGGSPIVGSELLEWASGVVTGIFGP